MSQRPYDKSPGGRASIALTCMCQNKINVAFLLPKHLLFVADGGDGDGRISTPARAGSLFGVAFYWLQSWVDGQSAGMSVATRRFYWLATINKTA